MSLLSGDVETGLFATSFRVVETLYGVATLAVTVALPVLSVAADEPARLRSILQRIVEVAAIGSVYLVLVVFIVAAPVLRALGGAQFIDAAPVLRIQVFALLPVFLAQVLAVALIAVRRPGSQALANAVALPVLAGLGFALIPRYDATGAAIAAVVAETVFALGLLVLFSRQEPTLRPTFRFVWKVGVSAGLGVAAAVAAHEAGLPAIVAAVVATVGYAAGTWLTGAVPHELRDAVMVRSVR
jgi:O-antigen/teichoic acid export membrane protein